MAWWQRKPKRQPSALTAAASPIHAPQSQYMPHAETWQDEVWLYHDTLGELNYATRWVGNMLSRIRLRAGKLRPDQDEPTIETSGLAVDLVAQFGGGATGRSQIMRSLGVHLSLPGECYVVGEQAQDIIRWTVRSKDEVRAQSGRYQVVGERVPNVQWVDLPEESIPIRIWQPHERYFHLADSPARAARGTMRELELVNRHIAAQYLSRLAMAGVITIPDELEIPVREEFQDAPSPFVREWVEVAAEGIKTPGAASAVVPIPLRGPAELLDKIKHLDFTLKIDEKIIEKRESAIKRLATQLNMPAEILLGMGDVNHWGQWALEEGALKIHIAPYAETLCHDLTMGYLQPRLKASNEADWASWCFWYDMSELALRPDKSKNAMEAYDRQELSGAAMRREIGFDEDDKPTAEELREQGLKLILRTVPEGATEALGQLTGKEVAPVVPLPAAPEAPAQETPAPEEPTEGVPPKTEGAPASAREAARVERSIRQSKLMHLVRITPRSFGPQLLHPADCREHLFSCPFTHALRKGIRVHPGSAGIYELRLDVFGMPVIGAPNPYVDTATYLPTRSNGYALH